MMSKVSEERPSDRSFLGAVSDPYRGIEELQEALMSPLPFFCILNNSVEFFLYLDSSHCTLSFFFPKYPLVIIAKILQIGQGNI